MLSARNLTILSAVISAGVSLLVAAGCDRATRYKVLTFFFEAKKLAQRRGSRHEPARECNKCHAGGRRSGRRELIKPVPDLCYTCHQEHNTPGEHLHGPLGLAGDICLFCHLPHQSGFAHLQRAPLPELCYRCHRREDMHTIVDHENRLDRICTDCHDPHSSPRDKLLKPYEQLEGDPNSIKLSI